MTRETAFYLSMFSAITKQPISIVIRVFNKASRKQKMQDMLEIKSALITYKQKNPEHYDALASDLTEPKGGEQ